MRNGNVLISGAGIAGPALAYWLRRHGFTPTVVERAAAPRRGGQAVDIRGTARDAITRMGVMDAVRAQHTGTHGIAYVNENNKRLASMRGEDFGHSGGIIAEIEILRGDLVRILHDATDGVEYVYDDMITGLVDGPDGVDVTFAKSRARRFDIVVGADGSRSGVRSLAFGEDSRYVRDLGYYSAYFTAHTDLRLDGWEVMFSSPAGNGVGGRLTMLYPLRNSTEVRAMFAFAAPELRYDRRDVEAQKTLLASVFDGVGWEVPGLLRQLRAADELYFARVGEVRLDTWSAGRAVLLGDSAFGGSLGMGTSMALVGAYVLAGELAAANGDHGVAFGAYEREMRDYVTASQRRPPAGMLPRTRAAIWTRNMLMRALPHLPGSSRILGGIDKASTAITLRDYGLAVPAHQGS
jgi:2-polyprenyl-6-methoxyphenol hydroxylase-like FAD-dependent oxidoreductase